MLGEPATGADAIGFLLCAPGGPPGFLEWLDAEHSITGDGWCVGCRGEDGPFLGAGLCPVRPWIERARRERDARAARRERAASRARLRRAAGSW